MKKSVMIWAALLMLGLLAGCAQKAPDCPYAADSPQYGFFKTMSDSLGITVLSPDHPQVLVSTTDFSIWSYDIMPGIFARLSRYQANPASIPVAQVNTFIAQGAKGEAEKRLLADKAEKAGIAIADSVVEAEMARYYSAQGGKENFAKMLEAQGFTLDYVANDVKTNLSIQKFIEEYLKSNTVVTEEALKAAYEAPKNATVRHILFETRGKSDEELKAITEKANAVLARAKAGEDFAALAKEFTDDPGSKENGGLYEKFTRGRMMKPFEDASFGLPVGSISDLVETTYGYHIIKVVDREKETRPFEEVKTELETQLSQTQRRDTFTEMMESLKLDKKFKMHI